MPRRIDIEMMIIKIAGAAFLLIFVVSGLSALARKRRRKLSPAVVLGAGLTFAMVCVRVILGGDLLPAPAPRVSTVLVGASWLSAAFLVLKVVDFLVIGEYLIDRHGAYIPDVVRQLIVGVGLVAAGLVILQVLLKINPIALVALPTVMTAIVGVALRDTLVRFFSGIALGKMIRVGDWGSVLDREGNGRLPRNHERFFQAAHPAFERGHVFGPVAGRLQIGLLTVRPGAPRALPGPRRWPFPTGVRNDAGG